MKFRFVGMIQALSGGWKKREGYERLQRSKNKWFYRCVPSSAHNELGESVDRTKRRSCSGSRGYASAFCSRGWFLGPACIFVLWLDRRTEMIGCVNNLYCTLQSIYVHAGM